MDIAGKYEAVGGKSERCLAAFIFASKKARETKGDTVGQTNADANQRAEEREKERERVGEVL